MCCFHFAPDAYERDLRNELLGLPSRKKLLPAATPTLRLPFNGGDNGCPSTASPAAAAAASSSSSSEPLTAALRTQYVNKIIEEYEKSEEKEKKKSESDKCDNSKCREELLRCKAQVRRLYHKLALYKKEGMQIMKVKERKVNTKTIVRKELLKRFTRANVNFLMGKVNRPGLFTQEEIVNALILRTMSSGAYKFLRANKMLCLPSLPTLYRWIRNGDAPVVQSVACLPPSTSEEVKNEEDVKTKAITEVTQ